jgi:hypothetical protein
MMMLIPDVIFILKTAVKAQDLDLLPDNEILLFRTINWTEKEEYIFHNKINEKETGNVISL